MIADTPGMGESENLCSRNQCSTLQRSVVPGLDSFGRLNFYFLALLNLLQLPGWIFCDCILLPHLLWHNSLFLSIHCYSPILAYIVTNRWTNQVNLKSKFTVAENKSMHIQKEKQKRKKCTLTHSFINVLRLKLRFHKGNGLNQATKTSENACVS